VWDKGNHLALVTMVQAAHGPDEDPLVEFDSPALNCMHERLVFWEWFGKFEFGFGLVKMGSSSDGFWSKKSIRELLSLLLLRHGMVWLKLILPGFGLTQNWFSLVNLWKDKASHR
jgi:hypothetical protein